MKSDSQPVAAGCRRPRGRPRVLDPAVAIACARAQFRAHGFRGTTLARLTAALGVAPPRLYAVFASKAGLFRAVLAEDAGAERAAVAAALHGERTARAAIIRLLREAARRYADPSGPGALVAIGELAGAPQDAALAAEVAAIRAETVAGLEALIARGVATAEFPPSTDPRALARFFAAVLQGMSVQARDGADAADLAGIAEAALAALPKGL